MQHQELKDLFRNLPTIFLNSLKLFILVSTSDFSHRDGERKFFNRERKDGRKSLGEYGNLSTHEMNSYTKWTHGPNPSRHRYCIIKAKSVSSCQKGCESKLGLSPLLRVPTLVRFQFCTCSFQPLLLYCCQRFSVNRKKFKPFTLLHKVFCLSSTFTFVFWGVCFSACPVPILRMLS